MKEDLRAQGFGWGCCATGIEHWRPWITISSRRVLVRMVKGKIRETRGHDRGDWDTHLVIYISSELETVAIKGVGGGVSIMAERFLWWLFPFCRLGTYKRRGGSCSGE